LATVRAVEKTLATRRRIWLHVSTEPLGFAGLPRFDDTVPVEPVG